MFLFNFVALKFKTMYQTLTFLHSTFRWLVLISLLYTIFRGFRGYYANKKFSKRDNYARHCTATVAHIQLLLGITIYSQSPIIRYFWNNFSEAKKSLDLLFFGLIHISLMLISIILITIGSSVSKRKLEDRAKFKTMFTYYAIALIIILVAVPWPFSPFANRPYFR